MQLRLEKPVALTKGDRFIIRQPSPSVTIGGGRVVNPFPGRRHRRFRAEVIERLETLAHGTPEEILLQDLERWQPCEARDLFRHSNLSLQQAKDSLRELVGDEQVFVLDSGFTAASGEAAGRSLPAFVMPAFSSLAPDGGRCGSGWKPC